jgi:hypothetical protein
MLAPRNRTTEVLLVAVDIIEQDGWCQGITRRGTAACTAQALRIAARHDPFVAEEAGRRLAHFVGCYRPGSYWGTIPDWNDAAGRTKEEVVEALRGAAFAAVA